MIGHEESKYKIGGINGDDYPKYRGHGELLKDWYSYGTTVTHKNVLEGVPVLSATSSSKAESNPTTGDYKLITVTIISVYSVNHGLTTGTYIKSSGWVDMFGNSIGNIDMATIFNQKGAG